jgi:hypothetical protein
MPSTIRAVSRRRVLLGAATLAVVSAAASTCGSRPEPPKVDDLKSQLDLARRDSEMAKAAAAGADSYAAALTVVAGERAAHARALSQEIARAAGASPSPAPTPSPSPTSATASAAAPTPPPSLSDVTTALRTSADGAAQLAAKLSGYRAGLLGSIAASCAASVTVPLAIKEPTQ